MKGEQIVILTTVKHQVWDEDAGWVTQKRETSRNVIAINVSGNREEEPDGWQDLH